MTHSADDPLLILGVGNVLVGDEGVGVHAARMLEGETWPDFVHVLDGGTGGFHLLGWMSDFRRIILIDATRDGQPAGTVSSFRPRLPSDFPPGLGAHDIGLKDLIGAAALTGPLPDIIVVTISIQELIPMSLELSEPVRAALPHVRARVFALVESAAAAAAHR